MDENKLREIAESVYGTCATEQEIKFARRLLAAADAEAVPEQPVAHIHRSNNNEVNVFFAGGVCPIDGNSVSQDFLKALPLNKSVPLYTRPQPAPDVGVLVEALERIYKFPLETKAGDPMAVLEMGSIAGNALDAWRAKR